MDKLFDFKGKVVCIIGGTGLIGSLLVRSFASRGANVFVGTRFPAKYGQKRKRVRYFEVDIRSSDSVRGFIQRILGVGRKIDIWINCALPLVNGSGGRMEEVDLDIITEEVNSHLLGFYRCCSLVMPHMKKNRHGVIINFGSVYGDISPDFRIYRNTEIRNRPAYTLTEGGILAFTKYLACYLAPFHVRVNAVCPGGVLDKHSGVFQKKYGDRVPMGRMAHSEEIIGPVLFLASEASSYVTGHLLFVDGGLRAW